jgi:hypothetical protein
VPQRSARLRASAIDVRTPYCQLSSVLNVTYDFSSLIESNITSPALPITDVSSLLATLDAYLTRTQPVSKPIPAPCMLNSLIANATASAPAKPLSEHNANVLSDIFCSLHDFEEATRTQEGRAILCNFLDRSTAEDVVDFWADEWIA